MKIIITVLIVSLLIVAHQEVVFKVEGDIVVLRADWLQNVTELDQHLSAFHSSYKDQALEKIILSFAYCTDPKYIVKNIFQYKLNAKIISINLDTCKIGSKGIEHILQKINKRQIESLYLGLNSLQISHQTTEMISQSISQMKLKDLKLEFMFSSLKDQGVSNLFAFPLNKQIQTIKLDLSMNKLGPEAFTKLETYLQNADSNNLKTVELILRSNKVEQQGTQKIYQALKRFKKLQSLTLDFYFNNLKGKGSKKISEMVKHFIVLKHLSLNFDLNYIETEGGNAIGQAIKNLTALQSLEIGVGSKNFGYNGYFSIVKGIENLSNLQSLIFRCGVNRVGTKGAQRIKEAISKLQKLQYLDLGFSQNFILDDGVKAISEAIDHTKNLKSLRLSIGFNQVRGYGAFELFKVLQKKKINKIYVSLSNNPFEDSELKLFIPSIKQIVKNSQLFELELLQTKISEQVSNLFHQIFDQANSKGHLGAILHINSSQQSLRTRQELQKINHPNIQSKITDL